MSDFTTIVLLFVIAIPHMFLYLSYEKWMQDRADAIGTGIIRGVSVSMKHRQTLVLNSWLSAFAGGIGSQAIYSIGYSLLARTASAAEVRQFAYLITFFSVIGLVNWLYQAPIWYFHLRSVLREAEAG